MLGAVERVRPKMMTVVAIIAGLLPIMWSTGTGTEVMQRIAVPMIGGILSSTVLTLIVIPAVYALIKGWIAQGARRDWPTGSGQPACYVGLPMISREPPAYLTKEGLNANKFSIPNRWLSVA